MAEFRYLFRVNKEQPEIALKALSFKVTGDPNMLAGADLDFIAEQEYITTVPIEIALTKAERAAILFHHPQVRFIVTGVPSVRVASLIEYGYKVFAVFTEEELKTFMTLSDLVSSDDKDMCLKEAIEKCDDINKAPNTSCSCTKEEKTAVAHPDPVITEAVKETGEDGKATYKVNGKEVTEKEFKEKIADLEEKYDELIDKFEKMLRLF